LCSVLEDIVQRRIAEKVFSAGIVIFPVLAAFLFLSCKTVETQVEPGTTASITSSRSFEFRPGLRVTVLPFTVLGNPDRTIDVTEADRLSVKLQEMGFTIVESMIFQEHRLHLEGLVPKANLDAVQRVLDIDYLVFGTINYAYQRSYSLFGKGGYVPRSASVRFVDARSGEVEIIATTVRVPGSMAEEIGESFRAHFSGE
jgi:hypothetical protein